MKNKIRPMKKIMFNDKYGLTQAVLDGLKTMTRRQFYIPKNLQYLYMPDDTIRIYETQHNGDIIKWYDPNGNVRMTFEPKYKIGEVVAIAQSYKDIDKYYNAAFHRKTSIHGMTVDPLDGVSHNDIRRWRHLTDSLANTHGWSNKMFVKSDLMPHHIRITNIKVERLQDISDDDCLREGIEEHLKGVQYGFSSNIGYIGQYPFSNPREAFAALIDRISSKGIWGSNPYVWAYEFELIN